MSPPQDRLSSLHAFVEHGAASADESSHSQEPAALVLRSDFERFSSEEVERLRRLAAASSSPATRRAYTRHWRDFSTWCEGRGVQPLPASSETCALFLASMAERGLKVATIEQAMAAVSKAHRTADLPSPRTEAVRAVLGGIRRTLGVAQKQAAPATAVDLRAMVAALPSTLIGKRDAALLLVGFAGAFRRSELVALTRADVRTTENGLEVFLRRSKTDQEGAGRTVALPYSGTPAMCPVRRLQAWLDGSGIAEGPLFRYVSRHGTVGPAALSGQAVSEAIRRAARRAGLEADAFSGHSLRAGFVTQAMLARKADRDIMKQTGHKSLAMLLRYDRRADMWRDNAAAGLLD